MLVTHTFGLQGQEPSLWLPWHLAQLEAQVMVLVVKAGEVLEKEQIETVTPCSQDLVTGTERIQMWDEVRNW